MMLGPHDDEALILALGHQQLLPHALRERVDVVPTVLLGPFHTLVDEPSLRPAIAPALDELLDALFRELV